MDFLKSECSCVIGKLLCLRPASSEQPTALDAVAARRRRVGRISCNQIMALCAAVATRPHVSREPPCALLSLLPRLIANCSHTSACTALPASGPGPDCGPKALLFMLSKLAVLFSAAQRPPRPAPTVRRCRRCGRSDSPCTGGIVTDDAPCARLRHGACVYGAAWVAPHLMPI